MARPPPELVNKVPQHSQKDKRNAQKSFIASTRTGAGNVARRMATMGGYRAPERFQNQISSLENKHM
jgi:hypothetical protein